MKIFDVIFSVAFLFSVIRVTTPLLFASLGAVISEHSGISNIGIEGIMLTSALSAVLVSSFFGGSSLIGLFGAVLVGTLLGLLLAYIIIELDVNAVIAGIAFNLTASGATVFLMYLVTGDKGITSSLTSGILPSFEIPILKDIPILGQLLSGHNILTYLAIATVIALSFLLFKTRLGLHIRSSGENPIAVQNIGINVKKIRYIALGISGFLSALGGAFLSMGNVNYFVRDMVSGRGFIALAAAALGRNNPGRTLVACLLFGFAEALSINPVVQTLGIPTEIIGVLPYIVTVIALVIYSNFENRKTLAID